MGGSASVTEGCDSYTTNTYSMTNNINQTFISNVVTNCTNMNITENKNFMNLNITDNGRQSNTLELNIVDSQDIDVKTDQKNVIKKTVQFIAEIETLSKTGMDIEQSAAIVAAIEGTAASSSTNQTQQTAATAIEAEAVGPFSASVAVGIDNDTTCHNSTNVANNINTTISNNTTMNMTTIVSFSQETRQSMNSDSTTKQNNIMKINIVNAKKVKLNLNQANEIQSAQSYGASALMAAETSIKSSQTSTSDVKTSASSELTSENVTTQESSMKGSAKTDSLGGLTDMAKYGIIAGAVVGGIALITGVVGVIVKHKNNKKIVNETQEKPCDNTELLLKKMLVLMGCSRKLISPKFKDFKISDYDPTNVLQSVMSAINPVAGMLNGLIEKGQGPLKVFLNTPAGIPVKTAMKPLIRIVNKGIREYEKIIKENQKEANNNDTNDINDPLLNGGRNYNYRNRYSYYY